MENIIPHLFVGGDEDYEKIKDKAAWVALRCCKYGPGGHQQTLGYPTRSAPHGKNYLSVDSIRRRALNYIDVDDPNLIPILMIVKGLEFIDARLASGDNVLVACNAGHSRGPTTALLYLRAIGDLTGNFHQSEKRFRAIYDKYDPGIGTRTFVQNNWDYFENYLRKGNSNGSQISS